jgi:hypothetical protein
MGTKLEECPEIRQGSELRQASRGAPNNASVLTDTIGW